MRQTKITVETTEDDYFLFLKFKEAKDASFGCFETVTQYKRGYNDIEVKRTFCILAKSAFSESVNKKLVVLDTRIYELEIENRSLKHEIESLKSKEKTKKSFWG